MGGAISCTKKQQAFSPRARRSGSVDTNASVDSSNSSNSNSINNNRSQRRISYNSSLKPDNTTACQFNDDEALAVETLPEITQPEPDISEHGPLSVTTRIEYSSLARGEKKNVFGLVSIQAADAPPSDDPNGNTSTERQAMDLVCVLDVSGSMNGEKIQQLKDAVRFVIDNADPKDRLSIVTFNSSAMRVLGLKRMTAEGKDAATTAALQLGAGGGTSIAAGLSMGISAMEQRRQRNKVSAILLLTDGQDGSTRSQLPGLLERATQARCSVYAFGFGSDHDAALLGSLAEQARTPFTFVEDTNNISEAFAGAVGGLGSIVAQNVELTLDCAVPLKSVHTPYSVRREERAGGPLTVVTIPDVFAGERRDILVELEVPASQDGTSLLLQASLRYSDLLRSSLVQGHAVAMVTVRVDEPQPEMEPDLEVRSQRQRVEVTQVLDQAAVQSDGGNFDEALKILSAAEGQLSKQIQPTAMTEALNQELVDARSRMRSQSVWEHGGRAEVKDAVQMHKVQRCSNAWGNKGSKALYLNQSACESVARSKMGR